MSNYNATIDNRKARFNYHVLETYIAGIVLSGPEVCSIRAGKANISEAYCMIDSDNQFKIYNMHVSRPTNIMKSFGTSDNFFFDETRERVLLLNRKEINNIFEKVSATGITAVPLKIFRNEKGLYKVLIGICKGKKDYDKRETLKERVHKREIATALKQF